MRNVRLKVQKLLDRLRTAGFHNQRQPLGKDVIGEHHHPNREKGCRGIIWRVKCQADYAAGEPRECSEFNQHVLV